MKSYTILGLLIFLAASSAQAISWKPIKVYVEISPAEGGNDVLNSCLRRELRKFSDVEISTTDDELLDFKFMILGGNIGGRLTVSLIAFHVGSRRLVAPLKEKLDRDIPDMSGFNDDMLYPAMKSGRFAGAALRSGYPTRLEELCLEITAYFDNEVLEKERKHRKDLDEMEKFLEKGKKK